ncbi:lanthionine synthetase C family protein [Microbispora sp. ATCC PTA-5024]|uniref:lanthionine synthetase C family protein n=1 Tax=Microbispora sp. ATCC PTA-5024 TaxID=316330 RepID=UPI00040E2C62|nr:lanthionine synthetase C family protein [Microbispora sp. ATCC PTA-5024]
MTTVGPTSCGVTPDRHPARFLRGSAARRAARLVRLVAERLADPDEVAGIAARPGNSVPANGLSMWSPATLSHGFPGIAVFYAELGRVDPAWSALAHRHLRAGAAAVETAPSGGLFAGPASLLAAAQSCAGPAGHYRGLRRTLTAWLAADHAGRLAAARDRPGPGVAWTDYDVVHGLSGSTRLLLDAARDPDDETAAKASGAVTDTLRHLVRLTEPITVDGHEVPGWWVPSHLQPVEQDRRDYPRGDLNLGLAHGAAGPLSVLATATLHGVEVPGQREAVARLAEWLLGWTMTDDTGAYWPCRVSWDEQIAAVRPDTSFTRTAWCYGAPGVCAALHRAGLALGVTEWREVAVTALLDGLRRDRSAWRVDGSTVCHGYAGLLQVLSRVGAESGDPRLLDGCLDVARMVLGEADESAPFVFPHLVPDSPDGWRNATGYLPLDGAGLLEGAAGVACALLSVIPPSSLGGTDPAPERADLPPWDRCLALC